MTTMTDVTIRTDAEVELPEQFADLQRFATKWCHETEAERYEVRLASSMDELQDFYDTALPRAQAAMDHLDGFDLYDLPDKELNLLRLMFALIVITFPVEAFRQTKVPDTGSTYLAKTIDPGP
jgi:hypothetical protein